MIYSRAMTRTCLCRVFLIVPVLGAGEVSAGWAQTAPAGPGHTGLFGGSSREALARRRFIDVTVTVAAGPALLDGSPVEGSDRFQYRRLVAMGDVTHDMGRAGVTLWAPLQP